MEDSFLFFFLIGIIAGVQEGMEGELFRKDNEGLESH